MPLQTLAHGETVAQKFGKLGGISGIRMMPPPHRLIGAVVAEKGKGKTKFVQSNPQAFVYNLDISSTPGKVPPKASVWPALDSEGKLCEACSEGDSKGYNDPSIGFVRPVVPTWQMIKDKDKLICEMADAGDPDTPGCVVYDTLFGAIPLLQGWILANAVSMGLSNVEKQEFTQLYGESAYPAMYKEFVDELIMLRQHGVGAWFTLHLCDKMVKVPGSTERELREGYSITDNFWGYIFPWLEVVLIIGDDEMSTRVVKPGMTLPGGITGPEQVEYVTKKTRVLFTGDRPGEKKKTGTQRIGLPDKIALPENDGWAAFVAEYHKAATIVNV